MLDEIRRNRLKSRAHISESLHPTHGTVCLEQFHAYLHFHLIVMFFIITNAMACLICVADSTLIGSGRATMPDTVSRGRRTSNEEGRSKITITVSEEEDSSCSDSIVVIQDDGEHDDALKVILGKLTRMGVQNQMLDSKFVAFNVVVGYVTTYATYARFCHFLDIYGIVFIPVFFSCMFIIGLPLVYLEMALGQFTTMDAVFVFKRMAPIASGILHLRSRSIDVVPKCPRHSDGLLSALHALHCSREFHADQH
uniref:SSD domain-containing protein n=1 Tax=Angiostrongylus cantonensis TaxID=6313 RepID=A0A0K0DI20_ANGCA